MTEFENGIVAEFLNDRWALFVRFCEDRGMSEDDAEQIVKKLEGEE